MGKHVKIGMKPSLKKKNSLDLLYFDEGVLVLILSHMASSPKHLYYLSILNKSVGDIIGDMHDLWFEAICKHESKRIRDWREAYIGVGCLYEQHFKGCPSNLCMSPAPDFRPYMSKLVSNHDIRNIRAPYVWPRRDVTEDEKMALVKHMKKRVCVEHAVCCSGCGYKHGLSSFWKLGKKLCDMCFRDGVISNVELFTDYGVIFWDLFKSNPEYFQKIFCFSVDAGVSMSGFLAKKYGWIHTAERNFVKQHMVVPNPSVIFWKAHLDEKFDLARLRTENKQKALHVAVLTAHIRALRVRMLLAFRGPPLSVIGKIVRNMNRQTAVRGLKVDIMGVVGDILKRQYVKMNQCVQGKFLQGFFYRFHGGRASIVYDHNPRKLLEIIKKNECSRVFDLTPFYIPGLHAVWVKHHVRDAFERMMEVF